MRSAPLRNGFLALGFAALFAASSSAEVLSYKAALTGREEVPANDSKGTGAVRAKLDTVTMKLSWTVKYEGLTGPATAAHFHGPAKPGENAGPLITLAPPLTSPIKGEATLTRDQVDSLAKGLWYLNVHTAAHQSGEIRGQLVRKEAKKK